MEKDRVIEFLVGMMLLVLVFIMILIGIGSGSVEKHVVQNKVYNIDNSKTNYLNNYGVENKVYFDEKERDYRKDYVYAKDSSYWQKFRDYNSWGNHKKSKDLGLYTDTYEVRVINNEESRYFDVDFYLEDFWGRDKVVRMRKYVPCGEEKTFYYREIHNDRDIFYDWKYDVRV